MGSKANLPVWLHPAHSPGLAPGGRWVWAGQGAVSHGYCVEPPVPLGKLILLNSHCYKPQAPVRGGRGSSTPGLLFPLELRRAGSQGRASSHPSFSGPKPASLALAHLGTQSRRAGVGAPAAQGAGTPSRLLLSLSPVRRRVGA